MCIAILQKERATINRQMIKSCWRNNPHGAGLLWSDNGSLCSFKELKSLKTFIRKYEEVTQTIGYISKIVLHFRIATHGAKNYSNCHPHFVSDRLAFVHNGIIRVPMDRASDKSDTVIFNEKILQKLQDGFIENVGIQEMLMNYTSGSKLIFLTSDNVSYIVHENDGHWVGDVWFSNYSYRESHWLSSYQYQQKWYNDERMKLLKADADRFRHAGDDCCLSCGGFLDSDIAEEVGYCNDCLNMYFKDDLARELVFSE